jgi:hypothetical protein
MAGLFPRMLLAVCGDAAALDLRQSVSGQKKSRNQIASLAGRPSRGLDPARHSVRFDRIGRSQLSPASCSEGSTGLAEAG